MSDHFEIRLSAADDVAAIEALYREAFPNEDLLPLVRDLLQLHGDVLSLVGVRDGVLVGHVAFTRCGIEGSGAPVALLGPLAIASIVRGAGIGGALVRNGLGRLEAERVASVLVLGTPGYYGRFGFVTEGKVAPPFPLVEAWRSAWQSIRLAAGGDRKIEGRLLVPQPWQRPALWSP